MAVDRRFILPVGSSVENGIHSEHFSLQYIPVHVDEVTCMVATRDADTLMVKFDVEAPYRNIQLHPDDRFLLGLKWRGQFFLDLVLPFRHAYRCASNLPKKIRPARTVPFTTDVANHLCVLWMQYLRIWSGEAKLPVSCPYCSLGLDLSS